MLPQCPDFVQCSHLSFYMRSINMVMVADSMSGLTRTYNTYIFTPVLKTWLNMIKQQAYTPVAHVYFYMLLIYLLVFIPVFVAKLHFTVWKQPELEQSHSTDIYSTHIGAVSYQLHLYRFIHTMIKTPLFMDHCLLLGLLDNTHWEQLSGLFL